MEFSKELQQRILEQVENFLTLQDVNDFTYLIARSFECLTASKLFDGMDPQERLNITYDYNMLNEFLNNLNAIQAQAYADMKKTAEVG